MKSTDVVVVGAGVIGCATAYFLAKEGLTVTVVDKESVGAGASFHATGSFSLFGRDFQPGSHLQLGLLGAQMIEDLVPELQELTGIDILCQTLPNLRLALDEEELQALEEVAAWQSGFLPMQRLTAEDARHQEPRLSADVLGGYYLPKEHQLDSYRLTLAFASAAEKLGATLLNREVSGLEQTGGKIAGVRWRGGSLSCGAVVIAMGAWSAEAAAWLQFPVPVRPLKGEKLYLQWGGSPIPYLINTPKQGHLHTRRDGYVSVGSTGGRDRDLAGKGEMSLAWDCKPTDQAKMTLIQGATRVMPDLQDAELAVHLAGVRPLSPDRLPLIGPVPSLEGAYLATGHGTKGIHLSPCTGQLMADLICRGHSDLQLDAAVFAPARFTEDPHG
jgi:glycine oxidase